MADVVIELLDGAGDDPVAVFPGTALGQHRLAHAGEEEGVEQVAIGLVGEQVSVVVAVSAEGWAEGDVRDRLRLSHIAEGGRAGRVQGVGLFAKPAAEHLPRPVLAPGAEYGAGLVQGSLELGFGPAVREVQITEQCRRGDPFGKAGQGGVHRLPSGAMQVADHHQNSVPGGRLGSRAFGDVTNSPPDRQIVLRSRSNQGMGPAPWRMAQCARSGLSD
jgi:hypothetical protein